MAEPVEIGMYRQFWSFHPRAGSLDLVITDFPVNIVLIPFSAFISFKFHDENPKCRILSSTNPATSNPSSAPLPTTAPPSPALPKSTSPASATDNYCCCEGCPPGSCPFMSVSIDTSASSPDPSATNTLSCPCAVRGRYCCCAGCPRGTCRSGFH